MARYFGGFRDRLKKRSKNQPISEKDVDWIQVATTFSWSPIRREHHWLEPEDYLSSFLDSDGEEHLDIEDEAQGDGSVDHHSTPEAGYSEYELLDQTSSSNPISPDTNSFESAQEFHSDRTTQTPESSEVHKMRPGIDVPAELPLLDEYRFELLSALQRRGVRITIDKIGIPDDLEQHLVNYHQGNGSIDSYELRARLQQFKKQVIDSYESYQSLSDSMRVTGNATPPVEILQQAETEDDEEEDYESFILNSLNRLEATMRDEDRSEIDEGEEPWDDGLEEWGGPSDSSDDPSIRSSRGVENNPARTKTTGNAPGKEPGSSFFSSSTDFPDHEDNETWSEATLDLSSEPSYQIRDHASGVQDPSNADVEEGDLDNEESADASPANADLLKALNTIGSRLTDDAHEEESTLDAELEDGELMQQMNGRFGEAPEDESVDEDLLDGWEDSEEELTIDQGEDELLSPPSYVHERLQDSESNDEVEHNDDWDDGEEDRSTPSQQEASLSDLILQLRNDADHSIGEPDDSDEFGAYDTHEPEERFRASSSMAKLAEKTVSLRISDEEPATNVEDEPESSFETMDFESDMAGKEVPDDEESSAVLVESDDAAPQPAGRDYTSGSDDNAEERQRRIEREREKLFSIIDRLEKRARTVIDPPVEKDEETALAGDLYTEQLEAIESHSDGTEAAEDESEPTSESDTSLDELSVHDEPDEEVTAFEDPVAFDDTLIDIDVEEQEIAVALFDADESTEPHEMSPSDVAETPDMEIGEQEEAFAPAEETLQESDRPIEPSPQLEPETMHEEWSDTTGRRSDSFVQNIIPVVKQENSPTSNSTDTDDAVLLDASDAPESAVADAEYSDLAEVDEGILHDVTLEGVIEAIAFATEEPFALKRLARIYAELQGEKMPSEKQMMDAISALNAHYEETNRAFRIKMWGGGIRMASHPQYAPFIRALYEDNRPRKLSRTLMETLAIIAYSQPTTKPEVDFVRGVDSDYAVRKLLELGLIDIVGRSEAIGRPLLYGTSERFLEQFGLSQLEALPKLREVEDLLGDPAFKKERLHLLALEGLQEIRVEAQDADENESEPEVAESETDEDEG